MDNREYKIRLEQISSLAAENDFKKAVKIADRIDWRRVPADMTTLMQISQLYRLSGRSDEAVEMLRLAYKNNKKAKKRPNKKLVYALCDLYLERGDADNAEKTYRLYKNLDPDSIEKLILQYRLVELCGGSLRSQIDILKQMHNFAPSHPEWRYQLAYLYHRAGATRECVETCDDIVRWFFKGPVVIKALELKMLHERLTPEQQRIYDVRNEAELRKYETDDYSTEYYDDGSGDETEEIQVKLIDQDKFNTVNLSRELAASMAELLAGEEEGKAAARDRRKRSTTRKIVSPLIDEQDDYPYDDENGYGYSEDEYRDDRYADERYAGDGYNDGYQDERYPEEAYREDQYAGDGYAEDQYADERYAEQGYTDGYQDDRYAGEGYAEDQYADGRYAEDGYVDGQYQEEGYASDNYDESSRDGESAEDGYQEEEQQETDYAGSDQPEGNYEDAEGQTFFEDRTNELVIDVPPAGLNPGYVAVPVAAGAAVASAAVTNAAAANVAVPEDVAADGSSGEYAAVENSYEPAQDAVYDEEPDEQVQDDVYEEEPEVPARRSSAVRVIRTSGRGEGSIFTQNADGQMSFDMDQALVEKQITGQLTLEEALENWDVRKDSTDDLIYLDTEKRIQDSTGPIFADFEKRVKESIARHTEPEPPVGLADRIFEDKYTTAGIDLVPLDTYMEEHEQEETDSYERDGGMTEDDQEAYDAAGENPAEDTEPEVTHEDEYLAEPEENDFEGVSQDTHGTTIWKEVDAALQADREAAKNAEIEPLGETSEGVSQDTHGTTIWKEVDAALQAEKAAAGMADAALGAGEAVAETAAAGAMAAGTVAAGAEAAETGGAAAAGAAVAGAGIAGAEAVAEIAETAADAIEAAADDDDDLSPGAKAVAAALADDLDDEPAADSKVEAEAEDVAAQEEPVDEDGDAADEEAAEAEEAEEAEIVEDSEDTEPDENDEADAIEETEGADSEDADEVSDEEGEEDDESDSDETDADGSDEAEGTEEEVDEEAEEEAVDKASLSTGQIDQIGDALENDADRIGVETVEEINDVYDPENGDPDFSDEEIEIFEHFFYSKKMRDQILVSIDNLSLAPYVGNVIITGGEKEELRGLAKALLRELQLIEGNFREDRVARVSGAKMNKKDVAGVLAQLDNGALLIEGASDLKRETLEKIANVLEKTDTGIVIMLIDEKKAMDAVIREYPMLDGYFNARIDMAPLTDAALVEYAKNYAYRKEYKIDEERAVLALHQRIDELQIGEHNVSLAEVEEIVDEAIYRSSHHLVSTFLEILSGKRYDKEDAMIILRERDFQGRRGGVA